MDIRLFIEQIIKQEMDEMAVGPDQASQQNIALVIFEDGHEKQLILYRPDIFEEAIKLKAQGVHDFDIAKQAQPTVGIMFVSNNQECDTWEVTMSAAEKGFGPLLYDIAFSLAGSQGMMPDRSSIKPAARNVWLYNFTKRKNDFYIQPLADAECLFTGSDKEEYLNYRYSLKTSVNTSQLQTNHQIVLNKIKKISQGINIRNLLDELAIAFFRTRYKSP